MTNWVAAHTSVTGGSHIKSNIPCQDAHSVTFADNDRWVVVVVSDGAGSASRSQEGSAHVARYFTDELINLIDQLQTRAPGEWISDFIIERVLQTRHQLRTYANKDDLSDFHCTLVACVQGPTGGFAIHLGDGSIIGGYTTQGSTKSKEIFASEPENGEYTNETFFITESSWVKHLRITPMPRMDWFICCTDGGDPFILKSKVELKLGFVEPVFTKLQQTNSPETRNKVLTEYLIDPMAERVTDDDKTLAIVWSKSFQGNFKDYMFTQASTRRQTLKATISNQYLPLGTRRPEQSTSAQTQLSSKLEKNSLSRALPHKTIAIIVTSVALIIIISIAVLKSMNILFPPGNPNSVSTDYKVLKNSSKSIIDIEINSNRSVRTSKEPDEPYTGSEKQLPKALDQSVDQK
jgi:hypothetical protein